MRHYLFALVHKAVLGRADAGRVDGELIEARYADAAKGHARKPLLTPFDCAPIDESDEIGVFRIVRGDR